MDYQKHIEDLSWEIYLSNLKAYQIDPMLKNLFELGKNAGTMELNGTNDIKIDTFNPFAH